MGITIRSVIFIHRWSAIRVLVTIIVLMVTIFPAVSTVVIRRQNNKEVGFTTHNSAMLQGLKPHAGGTGTSA
jgi:hypothetical protein